MIKYLAKKWDERKSDVKEFLAESLKLAVIVVGMTVLVKGTIAEARYIPSGSMEPNLNIEDRVLVEKLSSSVLGRPIQRGDILVFYPPAIETGVPDNGLLGKYIPFVPESPPAFIKRVVGLPGDKIRIKSGVGVFVNGKLLEVPGAITPDYELSNLGDIRGYSMNGKFIRPYSDSDEPIVVPANSFFMLGDNRNASADSHVWGFVKNDRVVGRACLVFWKQEWLRVFLRS